MASCHNDHHHGLGKAHIRHGKHLSGPRPVETTGRTEKSLLSIAYDSLNNRITLFGDNCVGQPYPLISPQQKNHAEIVSFICICSSDLHKQMRTLSDENSALAAHTEQGAAAVVANRGHRLGTELCRFSERYCRTHRLRHNLDTGRRTLTENAESSINAIADSVNNVAHIIDKIVVSSEELNRDIQQAQPAVYEVDRIPQQNNKMAKQSPPLVSTLQQLTEQSNHEIDLFRLPDNATLLH
ncbi:TPA: hypothetical protein ACGTPM_004820 [Salmonella enterica]